MDALSVSPFRLAALGAAADVVPALSCVAFSVALGVAFSVALGIALGIAFCVALGIAFGLALALPVPRCVAHVLGDVTEYFGHEATRDDQPGGHGGERPAQQCAHQTKDPGQPLKQVRARDRASAAESGPSIRYQAIATRFVVLSIRFWATFGSNAATPLTAFCAANALA